MEIVSIWSALYSLEKNSGGDITSFTNQTWICRGIVHVVNRQIGLISRLDLGLVD